MDRNSHKRYVLHSPEVQPIPLQINVYTDGKTKQGSGSGYVMGNGKEKVLQTQSINLTGEASIFQAELIALQVAAKHLQTQENRNGLYIKKNSDSPAALQALNSSNCNAQAITHNHDALNALAEQAKLVCLTWIKAHTGQDKIKLVDKFANHWTQQSNLLEYVA